MIIWGSADHSTASRLFALGVTMRFVAVVTAVSALLLTSGAEAEKQPEKQPERHIFVIANNADDYGVDRCLASNAACGRTVANAYCHSHEYALAVSFRKVERDDIAGTNAASRSDENSCSGSSCSEFVAIECSR
jgi:hypothetical protein